MNNLLLICFVLGLSSVSLAFEAVKYSEITSWNFNATKNTTGHNPVKQLQCIVEESTPKDLCNRFALSYASCERAERISTTKKGWICSGDRMPKNITVRNRKVDCENLINKPGYFVNGSCALFYSLEYTSNAFINHLSVTLMSAYLIVGLLLFESKNFI